MSSDDSKSTLALNHSILVLSHDKHKHTQAMTARQKCLVAGPKTCCCSKQAPCIEEKQRVRPAVRYTQKKKKHIHTHTHKYACFFFSSVSIPDSWLPNSDSVSLLIQSYIPTCILACAVYVYVCSFFRLFV